MEFLNINLTKDSRIMLLAIYSQSLLLAVLKKTILFSGFKNPYKKSDKNRAWEDFLCPETSFKNAVQEVNPRKFCNIEFLLKSYINN